MIIRTILLCIFLNCVLYAGIGDDCGVTVKITGAIFFSVNIECLYNELSVGADNFDDISCVAYRKFRGITIDELYNQGAIDVHKTIEVWRDK